MAKTTLSKRHDLIQFLKHASSSSKIGLASASKVYVLGNPSADLDSIISAIIYSYFATRTTVPGNSVRQYIPIINLPDVRSGEQLRRLRPEFATALRLSTHPTVAQPAWGSGGESCAAVLKDSILTVADLKEALRAIDHNSADSPILEENRRDLKVLMVDWNVLPMTSHGRGIEGISDIYDNVNISLVGCIDHHEDESFIPLSEDLPSYGPRCIQPGIGSCTSLVIQELRTRGLWPDGSGAHITTNVSAPLPLEEAAAIYESHAAKLALAAILVDTANMAAESSVSKVDREALSFLEGKIHKGVIAYRRIDPKAEWDRLSFYEEIMYAKRNSVEGLTIEEILGRDYKEWTEPATDTTGKSIKVGICNVVRSLSWLLSKVETKHTTGGATDEPFLGKLKHFALSRQLDVVALMTVFTSQPGERFCRELLVWALNEDHVPGVQRFEAVATSQLGLTDWTCDREDLDTKLSCAQSNGLPTRTGWRRVWRQTDVAKSRKAVAPLLREAIAGKLN